jgi:guanylate kinase
VNKSKILNKHTGKLFTIAAPSGAGKTSLVTALVNSVENLYVSVSYTTRAPRAGEVNGINYFFVEKSTFERMIDENDFLEYAQVFHNYYGTSKSQVQRELASGKNVILEIDWQGVQQIHKQFPDCTRIFILPPSIEVLEQRLRQRAQDSEAVIADRLAGAKKELSHSHESDFLVMNDDFETALKQLQSIITD